MNTHVVPGERPPAKPSVVVKWAAWTAAILGGIGIVAGAVIGFFAYPPTAWFAALEIGVPASLLGLILGSILGMIAAASHRIRGARAG